MDEKLRRFLASHIDDAILKYVHPAGYRSQRFTPEQLLEYLKYDAAYYGQYWDYLWHSFQPYARVERAVYDATFAEVWHERFSQPELLRRLKVEFSIESERIEYWEQRRRQEAFQKRFHDYWDTREYKLRKLAQEERPDYTPATAVILSGISQPRRPSPPEPKAKPKHKIQPIRVTRKVMLERRAKALHERKEEAARRLREAEEAQRLQEAEGNDYLARIIWTDLIPREITTAWMQPDARMQAQFLREADRQFYNLVEQLSPMRPFVEMDPIPINPNIRHHKGTHR